MQHTKVASLPLLEYFAVLSATLQILHSSLVIVYVHIGVNSTSLSWWRRGVAVERRTRDREVVGSSLDRALRRKNSGQVSHT